uniref:Uncharacterized protein n=1 Tax=Sparus aurata TaxID=8175 RepID=A0A671V236_SPAAU
MDTNSCLPGESHSQVPPGRLLTFSPADDAPETWQSFTARAGEGPGLPSITYSLSQEGLTLTGQQYSTSLLNLLHNDPLGDFSCTSSLTFLYESSKLKTPVMRECRCGGRQVSLPFHSG